MQIIQEVVVVHVGEIHVEQHQSDFQDHVTYINNNIVKPFRVGIIHYTGCGHEMHNTAN